MAIVQHRSGGTHVDGNAQGQLFLFDAAAINKQFIYNKLVKSIFTLTNPD